MKKPLTSKQAEVYKWLVVFLDENLYFPTLREISEEFSIKNAGAQYLVDQLIEKGYLLRDRYKRSGKVLATLKEETL